MWTTFRRVRGRGNEIIVWKWKYIFINEMILLSFQWIYKVKSGEFTKLNQVTGKVAGVIDGSNSEE